MAQERGSRLPEPLTPEIRSANPLFYTDTKVLYASDHPMYLTWTLSRSFGALLDQQGISANRQAEAQKNANNLIRRAISGSPSKNYGMTTGSETTVDLIQDPKLGYKLDGNGLPVASFPVSIRRINGRYLGSVPVIGTEIINPYHSEAYIQVARMTGDATFESTQDGSKKSDQLYEMVQKAGNWLGISKPQLRRQLSKMNLQFGASYRKQLAEHMSVNSNGIASQAGSEAVDEGILNYLLQNGYIPDVMLPLRGTIHHTADQRTTLIHFQTNPIAVTADTESSSELRYASVTPHFGELTHVNFTRTDIAPATTPFEAVAEIRAKIHEDASKQGFS